MKVYEKVVFIDEDGFRWMATLLQSVAFVTPKRAAQ
jgi:hypothetical protein